MPQTKTTSRKILNIITKNPRIGSKELTKWIDRDITQVSSRLTVMAELGIIKRKAINEGRGANYEYTRTAGKPCLIYGTTSVRILSMLDKEGPISVAALSELTNTTLARTKFTVTTLFELNIVSRRRNPEKRKEYVYYAN